MINSRAPYGYVKVAPSDGLPVRLEICEDKAVVVREIFDWHANEGLSLRAIAIRLTDGGVSTPNGHQIWSTSTLERLLRNTVYIGTLYYNRRVILPEAARVPRHTPGHQTIAQLRPREEWIGVAVPPVIDDATWARSQARHVPNARFSPRHVTPERYLLRYLVRCGECGRARQASARKTGRVYTGYYCCPQGLPMRLREQRLRCTQPSARSDELDQLVWAEVTRHLQRPDLILKACSAPSQEPLAHQDRQLTELRGQQRRLIDAYQSGAISLTELEARRRPLDDRVGELKQSARSAHHRSNTKAQLQHQLSEFSQKVANRIGTMTFTERQQLVRSVLEEVLIIKQRVELKFKIPLLATPKEGRSRPSRVSDRLRSLRQGRSFREVRPRRDSRLAGQRSPA